MFRKADFWHGEDIDYAEKKALNSDFERSW